ncbi:ABC transporter ATP-binding protein [Isoptericola sp. BMS4]|uniref:ABC transporter ATP-binding protein n=1 Tax=Isoptericola sp. BMS4 TaxID=2527875 RepID=UPI001F0D2825|nr:ABC transporter ATP-binding protein [Isoptericola sp. BMS4]
MNRTAPEQHRPGITATGLTVGYGATTVLDSLDLELPAGAFTAVVGPNGCGKSTLVRALARTLRPTAGRVALDGRPLDEWRPKHLARHLAFLPQDPVVPDGVTVHGLVARGRHPYHSPLRQWAPGDDEAVAAAMAATGVDARPDVPVDSLSGGQRQRAWIAMTLAQDTRYVLLDEPTSFLDLSHQIDVLHLCQEMRDRGRTVVAVLHDLNQAARYADHLVVMRDGAVHAQGAPEAVLGGEPGAALVRDVFDLPCEIAKDPQSGTPMVVPLARP